MALNLWKVGGKPTSYNPLPLGLGQTTLPINIGAFTVTIKAKSASSAKLTVWTTSELFTDLILTPILKEYKFDKIVVKGTSNFFVQDYNGIGDIIIDSIELVQKPLDKLTLNGVDGFASGKWTLHANAVVVDDETLEINPTAVAQSSKLVLNILPNTQYSVKMESGRRITYELLDGSNALISGDYAPDVLFKTFVTPSNASKINIIVDNSSTVGSKVIIKRPMLTLGTSPIPYEKKRGDKMVLPVFKNNLFDKRTVTDNFAVSSTSGNIGVNANISASDFISVLPTKTYTRSTIETVVYYDLNKQFISSKTNANTFTTPLNTYFIRVNLRTVDKETFIIEEGTSLSYAVQVNKKPQRALAKSKTGLSFNGITDYLQLPSMTMDSIEIECLIDSVQPVNAGGYNNLVDARNGLSNGYYTMYNGSETKGAGWASATGFVKGQRTKLKLTANAPFTDDVTLFCGNTGGGAGVGDKAKGTLYKVTCYLNNAIVAQYDFENPRSIVGNQVLQNAQNLIPSFEDSRWSIHANAKVLGKDVLHLDATGAWQANTITIPVLPNQSYSIRVVGGNYLNLTAKDSNNNTVTTHWDGGFSDRFLNFTTQANASKISINLTAGLIGSFDFIRPQLYALDGKEGTMNGSPGPQVKQKKRTLFSKR